MAMSLVPAASAIALLETLPTYAELTPTVLTSAVSHAPSRTALLTLRSKSEGKCCALYFNRAQQQVRDAPV